MADHIMCQPPGEGKPACSCYDVETPRQLEPVAESRWLWLLPYAFAGLALWGACNLLDMFMQWVMGS